MLRATVGAVGRIMPFVGLVALVLWLYLWGLWRWPHLLFAGYAIAFGWWLGMDSQEIRDHDI
jgi:hypothetical protein